MSSIDSIRDPYHRKRKEEAHIRKVVSTKHAEHIILSNNLFSWWEIRKSNKYADEAIDNFFGNEYDVQTYLRRLRL